jgi:hypothetical protein
VVKTTTMKKILSLLVLTLVIATGCKSQSASAEAKKLAKGNVSYEYKAYTRGSHIAILIDEKSISAAKSNPAETHTAIPFETNKKDWNTLLAETAKLNLDKLETFEAPSKKHQFDGAMAATLKITVDGKEYSTQTFDHGNPPAEIKELVEKIIAVSGLEKQ